MSQNLAIKNYIEHIRKKVDLSIKKNLPQGNDRVSRAMRYAVLSGGKRLRPVLFIIAVKSLGGKLNRGVMKIAPALEFIHTFSLIQDDLPGLDNDDYRRGKPTVHKLYGEDIAILASDSLLNEAYKMLLEESSIDAGLRVRIACELMQTVKILINGQEKDLGLAPRRKVRLSRLNKIYLGKTAALIAVSIKIAGILRKVKTVELKHLNSFGMKLGLAYQILDDILNVTADNKEFKGKQFSDQKNEKVTYVSIAGIQESREITENLVTEAKNELAKINGIDKFKLSLLCDVILKRTY